MPRYFFTVSDGVELEDPHGSELPDLAAATHEARQIARGLLNNGIRGGLDRRNWSIHIVDESGDVLRVVPFVESVRPDTSRELDDRRPPSGL